MIQGWFKVSECQCALVIPAFISSWSPWAACNITFSAVQQCLIHSGMTRSVPQLAMNHSKIKRSKASNPQSLALNYDRVKRHESFLQTIASYCIALCNDSASGQFDFTRHIGSTISDHGLGLLKPPPSFTQEAVQNSFWRQVFLRFTMLGSEEAGRKTATSEASGARKHLNKMIQNGIYISWKTESVQ